MRRRFFNAADNFVGGCYNKLSNEDIKRLGGKRPYVCQFNKIHIHIGPVLKDHDSDVSYIMFNSNWNHGGYEADNSGNAIKLNGEFSDVSTVFNIPSLKVTTLRDGSLSFPEIYIEGVWDPSLYKSVL